MFLAKKRVPRRLAEDGFLPVCPDLAVEVVSPSDSFHEVMDKAESFLNEGVRLVWVLDIEGRRAYVLRPGKPVERKATREFLEGEEVLPGFRLELAKVLGIRRGPA